VWKRREQLITARSRINGVHSEPPGRCGSMPHKQRVATGEKCALKLTPLRAARAGFDRTTATDDVIRGEEQM
jgi:hypothetical protein